MISTGILENLTRPQGACARRSCIQSDSLDLSEGAELRFIDVASTYEDLEESSAASEPASGDQRGVTSAGAMQNCRRVTWPQRGLLIGVVVSALVVVTDVVPRSLMTSTAPSVLLWGAAVLNALLLLVLGPTALVTTRRWIRQGLPFAQLRRQRRAVRRRALVLGVVAYLAHQTLVVFLDPRLSLEALMRRRRLFGPIATFPDRLELAWAFTAVAFGYIVLTWLLWRSVGCQDPVPSDVRPRASAQVLGGPPPPVVATAPPGAVEVLPRDPVTGRVVRQFDV